MANLLETPHYIFPARCFAQILSIKSPERFKKQVTPGDIHELVENHASLVADAFADAFADAIVGALFHISAHTLVQWQSEGGLNRMGDAGL
jgi:hypothetical protein